ncbi:hypothetical protein [Rhabdaerophilum sp. SD176]|uniref:hypothetical protein n=1 Tax=Rhabdaerophilum sp. SD176 TaxID=2983548 RepID=UPI0024DFD8D3|nr:hypothetical protein [Rhabdaerophilum sp. SD176]
MADERALLTLRQLQARQASEALAREENRCRVIEARLATAMAGYDALAADIQTQRADRIDSMIQKPTHTLTMVRLRLQHSADDEALTDAARAIIAMRDELTTARQACEIARRAAQSAAKAEKKVTELVNRIAWQAALRHDALTEEEH